MLQLMTPEFAGQPIVLWLGFVVLVLFFLWLDLGVMNRKDGVVSAGKSAIMWSMFASCALAFGAGVYFFYEPNPAYYPDGEALNQQATVQYFTGYLLETALAFDNIFVMSLVFTFFAVPREYQHRVLFWGILGAIVFRAIFIGFGTAVVHQFSWVLFIFAGFLIFTGLKMLFEKEDDEAPDMSDNFIIKLVKRVIPVTEEVTSNRFFTKAADAEGRIRKIATPLFLALISVECVDIIFAVDSVPAILAVTRDPFIVYTSNIFAILGLRSMYFMLSAAVERFAYLKYGLSLVLILIGIKIFWNFGLHDQLGLVPYLKAQWSLATTLALLGGSMLFSLWATRRNRS